MPMPTTFLVADMSDVVTELATGEYEIRPGVEMVDDGHGRFKPGPSVPPVTGVVCSVQPLQGDEVRQLQEGDSLDAWREVYTAYALKPLDEATRRRPDVIMVDPETGRPGPVPFEVKKTHPWRGATGVVRAIVRKMGRSP